MEAGASVAQAAARELVEETGLRVPVDQWRGPIARSGGTATGRGFDYWSDDRYFFLRVDSWRVDPTVLGPLVQAESRNHRW